MTTIEVLLQIPEHIQIGLDSGTYERIGGVIREVTGRKIVAWLRDGIEFGNNSSLPNPTQALMSLSGTGALLNVAVSSASLLIIINRLERLSTEIENLGQIQQAEFERLRETKFTGALDRARDAIEATESDTRKQLAHHAIGRLKESEDELLKDVKQAINENRLVVAQYAFLQSMYALTSRVRCYLEMEDIKLAQKRLREQLPIFEEWTRELIRKWLSDHPAIFLHKAVSNEDVYRFIRILEWLSGKRFVSILVENLREDFWNDELTRDQNNDLFSKLRRDTPELFSDKINNIPNILTQVETLIENYERLVGFDLEIRSIRLIDGTFQKWRERYPEDKGFAVLYSDTPIDLENTATQ